MAAVLRTQCVRRAACEFARIDRELDADSQRFGVCSLQTRTRRYVASSPTENVVDDWRALLAQRVSPRHHKARIVLVAGSQLLDIASHPCYTTGTSSGREVR